MQTAQQRTEQPAARELGQVLQFPQRRATSAIENGGLMRPDDLARYEQDRPADDRTRTLTNMIAVAIVTVLIAVGVWITDVIAVTDRDQDCIMQGRSNCAPLKPPIPGQ
jgi:hypothetical protein